MRARELRFSFFGAGVRFLRRRFRRRLLFPAGFLSCLRCRWRRRGARRDVDLRRQHGHDLVLLFLVFFGLLFGAGPLGGRVCFAGF